MAIRGRNSWASISRPSRKWPDVVACKMPTCRTSSSQILTSVARSIEDWRPIDGGPPFRAWIAAIARNAITNALTRKPIDAAPGGSSAFARLHSLPVRASLDATHAELDCEARKHAVLWAAEQIRHEYSPEVWECSRSPPFTAALFPMSPQSSSVHPDRSMSHDTESSRD